MDVERRGVRITGLTTSVTVIDCRLQDNEDERIRRINALGP